MHKEMLKTLKKTLLPYSQELKNINDEDDANKELQYGSSSDGSSSDEDNNSDSESNDEESD
jgi:hypothetical protein